MTAVTLTLFVEGQTDKAVVSHILHGLKLADCTRIEVCGPKSKVGKRIANLESSQDDRYMALVDADEPSVADSRALAEKQLGNPRIPVFCAVPTIEAWLFADDHTAMAAARSKHAAALLERLPLPEMIPYPKLLAQNVFGRGDPVVVLSFLRQIDIARATSRSPSLRTFLIGVEEAFGERLDIALLGLGKTVSRDAFSTLLRELPGHTVVWRTMDGRSIRADEMAQAVLEGSEFGKQYATEVLRVARDLVARKARK